MSSWRLFSNAPAYLAMSLVSTNPSSRYTSAILQRILNSINYHSDWLLFHAKHLAMPSHRATEAASTACFCLHIFPVHNSHISDDWHHLASNITFTITLLSCTQVTGVLADCSTAPKQILATHEQQSLLLHNLTHPLHGNPTHVTTWFEHSTDT